VESPTKIPGIAEKEAPSQAQSPQFAGQKPNGLTMKNLLSFPPRSVSFWKRLGLSLKELAALANLSPDAIIFWEKGKFRPGGTLRRALNQGGV